MNNVTINGKNFEILGNTPFILNNGNLVLHYNRQGSVVGAYIVTSYREVKNNGNQTRPYCSLVNLDNGYLAFEERCSRNTTMVRILSHLSPCAYGGKNAVAEGQYIEVYAGGEYTIDISTKRG